MSRIGRQLIKIPKEVEVKLDQPLISCQGSKGKLELKCPSAVQVSITDDKENIKIEVKNSNNIKQKALWGTYNRLIQNIIIGVTQGYEKKLEIQGVGYKVSLTDGRLVLNVGFSHSVEFKKPTGIDLQVKGNLITVSGIDKQKVGQAAAQIRQIKTPDAYKGKGIRYFGEEVKLKPGKQLKGAEAGGK